MREWVQKVFGPSPAPERLNESDLQHTPSQGMREPQHPEAELTDTLFRDWRDQLQRWLQDARKDVEFYEGEHWDGMEKKKMEKKGQFAAEIPLTFQAVEQALSMMSARDPEFRVTAREDSDRHRAHLRSYLLQWIWSQSKDCGFHFKTALKDYYVRGRGFLYIYIDPDADLGKGEVRIKTIDPDYVIVPPNTKSPLYDDADHIIMASFMSAAQIKEMWPHVDVHRLEDSAGTHNESIWRGNDLGDVRTESNSSRWTRWGGRYSESKITNPLDFESHESRTYLVFERFTKVRRRYYRIEYPGHPFQEEMHDMGSFQNRMKMTGFILINQEGEQVIKDPMEVGQIEQLFLELGGIPDETEETQVQFHYVEGLPDPATGQPGQPVIKPGPPGPDAIPGSESVLIRTTIDRIVERGMLIVHDFMHTRVRHTGTVGDQILWEPYDLPTQHYPVIPILNSHNRHPYPQGDITRIRDLQRMYNKVWQLILANAATNAGPKLMLPQGSSMDIEALEAAWQQPGAKVVEYTPDPMGGPTGGIQVVHPGPMPGVLYQLLETIQLRIQETLGVYSLQQGDPVSAPETYRGTLAIDEFGTRRTQSKREDIYMAIARAGKISLDFATIVYDKDKVIRVVNSNGDQTVFQVRDYHNEAYEFQNSLINHYDVIVVAGSTLPSNRWAELQQKLEMFQMGAIDHEALLKSSDIPDAEGILQRMGMIQQLEQQLQSMQQHGMDLLKELDSMRKELSENMKGEEAEKFANELKVLIERERAEVDKDNALRDLEIKHQKELMQMERQQQKELMVMDRKIKKSSRNGVAA